MAKVFYDEAADEWAEIAEPPASIPLRYVKRASPNALFIASAKEELRMLKWLCASVNAWHLQTDADEWLDDKPVYEVKQNDHGDIESLTSNLDELDYERQAWLWTQLTLATFRVPLGLRPPSPNGDRPADTVPKTAD